MSKTNNPIQFENEGLKFVITKYEKAGEKLEGMGSHKIFVDNNEYFKNHEGELLKVLEFKAYQDDKEVDLTNYLFDTPTRVVGILLHENKVLIIHRIKNGKEYYVYPGGHLKQNESLLAGVIREIKEETNIDISNLNPQICLELEGRDRGFGPEKYFKVTLDTIPAHMFKTNPEDTRYVSEIMWVEIEEAKKLERLYPVEVIKEFF